LKTEVIVDLLYERLSDRLQFQELYLLPPDPHAISEVVGVK